VGSGSGVAGVNGGAFDEMPASAQADLLVVEKEQRQLIAYSHGEVLRTYTVSLGTVPIGPKVRQGDGRTPEGRYLIDHHNSMSGFHRALHVAYPSAVESAPGTCGRLRSWRGDQPRNRGSVSHRSRWNADRDLAVVGLANPYKSDGRAAYVAWAKESDGNRRAGLE
jgi:hypothetical protein